MRALVAVVVAACSACSAVSGLDGFDVVPNTASTGGGGAGGEGGSDGSGGIDCGPCPEALMWLEADEFLDRADGELIAVWNDRSGRENLARQDAPSSQPQLVADAINGLPAVHFDGVDDGLGFVGTERLNDVTFFIVYRLEAGATASAAYSLFVLGEDDDITGEVYGIEMLAAWSGASPDVLDVLAGSGNDMRATSPGIAAFDAWNLVSAVTSDRIFNTTLRVNGADAAMMPESGASIDVPMNVMIGNASAAGFGGLGGTGRLDLPFRARGSVAALIVFRTALLAVERRAVEEYLAAKYGLP